jgi:hypothetical protein
LLLPMYLPFTWIIPICVAGALFGHVVVLRWALGRGAAVAGGHARSASPAVA